ncbi:hypothetical protein NA56DRAFT_702232 [Hyaloscypha hepaticicola]|uniref:Uncharacterized protein n=1 Tax=Hyaloscypha hepaticicola TaxID=2082293 RepID=A0A2J6Q844_9HELO|nr:hypothetical protein NA56DRAFT_702232 [Hyaloscypha hepaticicola]
MYLPTSTTTNSIPTLLPTSTSLLPTSSTTPNPLAPSTSPVFGADTTMNLVFGISAFAMAAITIWQNRHYLKAMQMPWGKVFASKPSNSDKH